MKEQTKSIYINWYENFRTNLFLLVAKPSSSQFSLLFFFHFFWLLAEMARKYAKGIVVLKGGINNTAI